MRPAGVEYVAKAHEECVALPVKSVLYKRVGEFCAMEEVDCCDLDGMHGSCRDVCVLHW